MGDYYVKRSKYWNYFLNHSDAGLIFSKSLNDIEKNNVFNKYVNLINIETSTFCNRKCAYCPLAENPRKQNLMEDTLFLKIMDELRIINYPGHISLSLYNEPLLDTNLINKVKILREYLKDNYVQFNSNGDFLTEDYLQRLKDSGVNQILVTLHTNEGEEYEDGIQIKRLYDYLDNLGLSKYKHLETIEPNKNISLIIDYEGMCLLICSNNWSVYGNDRGGKVPSLSIENRILPCNNPIREFVVAYDGEVKSCCNIYFTEEDSFGNINNSNILDVYYSERMVNFRRMMFLFGKKNPICSSCNIEDNSEIESANIRERILKEYIE